MISEYSMAVPAPALSGYENQLLGFSSDWVPIIHPPPPASSTGYTDAAAAVTFAANTFRCSPTQTPPLPAHTFPHHDHVPHPVPNFFGFQLDVGSFHGANLVVGAHDPFMPVTDAPPPPFHSIDLFLKLQGERLRCAIHEQMKQQMGLLLDKAESRAREKDQELATAMTKTKELEERLRRAEAETEVWEKAAKDKEAMAVELSIMIQQVKQEQRRAGGVEAVDDAESACECDSSSASSTSSSSSPLKKKKKKKSSSRRRRAGAKDDEKRRRGRCRGSCSGGDACLVFLPCRHLCSCNSCEGILQLCPVCHSVKQATIEVHLSS